MGFWDLGVHRRRSRRPYGRHLLHLTMFRNIWDALLDKAGAILIIVIFGSLFYIDYLIPQ